MNEKLPDEWFISPKSSWFGSGLKELLSYKDLLLRLVRKEFLIQYQQTLLGPAWLVLNPILTVITYYFVFSEVMGLATDGYPPLLFYLAGITLWNMFTDIFQGTSSTFASNVEVFKKVYFPRMIAPLSITILHCLRMLIQIGLLLVVFAYYQFKGILLVSWLNLALAIPALLVTALIAMGSGLLFSIVTAKYKDLSGTINLLVRLMMFVSPVFYSLNMVPGNLKRWINLNPLTPQFELFRSAFLDSTLPNAGQLAYSIIFALVVFFFGTMVFNKMSGKLIDVY